MSIYPKEFFIFNEDHPKFPNELLIKNIESEEDFRKRCEIAKEYTNSKSFKESLKSAWRNFLLISIRNN